MKLTDTMTNFIPLGKMGFFERLLWNSKSYLGDYFRRMRSRQGAPKAITATAHKLARIIYHLIKNKTTFNASVFVEEEHKHQQRMKKRLINQAKSFGLQLVPA